MTYSTIDGWDTFGVIVSPPKTLSFESGRILIDGEVIAADDIGDLTINFDNNLLTTTLEVEKTFKARGQTQTVVSRHVAQLRL